MIAICQIQPDSLARLGLDILDRYQKVYKYCINATTFYV